MNQRISLNFILNKKYIRKKPKTLKENDVIIFYEFSSDLLVFNPFIITSSLETQELQINTLYYYYYYYYYKK